MREAEIGRLRLYDHLNEVHLFEPRQLPESCAGLSRFHRREHLRRPRPATARHWHPARLIPLAKSA